MTPEERLREFYEPARRIARGASRTRPDLFDDLTQEAIVRAWQVLAKRPDCSNGYVVRAMRNRVVEVASGAKGAFGKPSQRGSEDSWRRVDARLDVRSEDAEEAASWEIDERAQDALDAVVTGAPVRAAVRSLEDEDDRLLVFLRYWQDRPDAEIGERLGVDHSAISWRWTHRVRPQLRAALAAA